MRAPTNTIATARRLRRSLTPPEVMLWSRLRARSADLPTFRRQHPIGAYVVDFYCAKARLAVEIDGLSHEVADRPARDATRDAWLSAQGVTVVRVPAIEVMKSADEVVDGLIRLASEIISAAQAPTTALTGGPPPPFHGGG